MQPSSGGFDYSIVEHFKKEVISTEDQVIVSLYRSRSQQAIAETAIKYGKLCHSIAYGVLSDYQDADECVNDTYLEAWNSIPPHEPHSLSAFLAKITRRLSIDKWRRRTADKRGGGEIPLALDELNDCIPGNTGVEQAVEAAELARTIDRFLERLPQTERELFVGRYWYIQSISALSQKFRFSESKTKSMLYRTRKKLQHFLELEGIPV